MEVGPAKWKSFLGLCSSASLIYAGVSMYNGNEKFYEKVLMPATRLIDPESAHRLAIVTAKYGLATDKAENSELLRTSLCGLDFSNPLGMAAGFDKNAEAVAGLHKMGFGFVEIGKEKNCFQ